MTPTDPETPQTAAGRALLLRLTTRDTQDNRPYDAHILAIEAEARAARDAEVRALVERLPGRGIDKTVNRAAVLAILSDTPETP